MWIKTKGRIRTRAQAIKDSVSTISIRVTFCLLFFMCLAVQLQYSFWAPQQWTATASIQKYKRKSKKTESNHAKWHSLQHEWFSKTNEGNRKKNMFRRREPEARYDFKIVFLFALFHIELESLSAKKLEIWLLGKQTKCIESAKFDCEFAKMRKLSKEFCKLIAR